MNFDHLDPDEVYRSRRTLQASLLRAAWNWAQDRSKDPRTKVGAVVYDPKTGASFFGYNGFNSGMPDFKALWDCRDTDSALNKYNFVRHAEANAIEKAMKLLGTLEGCFLVVTHLPCKACMKDFISPSGIKQVYYHEAHDNHPLTWIHAKAHGITFTQIELVPGVGKFYEGPLAVPYGQDDPTKMPPRAKHADRKQVKIEQHAVDQLRSRYPNELTRAEDQDIRRLLVGMFYNGHEVGERVVNNAFVRVAHFNSGTPIALSCKDEGNRYAVITVLYPDELDETGIVRFPEG